MPSDKRSKFIKMNRKFDLHCSREFCNSHLYTQIYIYIADIYAFYIRVFLAILLQTLLFIGSAALLLNFNHNKILTLSTNVRATYFCWFCFRAGFGFFWLKLRRLQFFVAFLSRMNLRIYCSSCWGRNFHFTSQFHWPKNYLK